MENTFNKSANLLVSIAIMLIFTQSGFIFGQHNNHLMDEHMAVLALTDPDDATHISSQSGNWSDPETWGGVLPTTLSRVHILSGHEVTVDGIFSESLMNIRVDGMLKFATNVNTQLSFDTMVITENASFEMGTALNPISPNVQAKIIINDLNNGFEVSDTTSPDYDPHKLGQGIISHGSFVSHGAEKTPYVTFNGALAGTQTLTLDVAPNNWRVGDRIVVAGSIRDPNNNQNYHDTATILTINGNSITLDTPLTHDHTTPRHDKQDLTLKVHVANLSRNVTIETAEEDRIVVQSYTNGFSNKYHGRGHTMFMHTNNANIRYTNFYHLGRTHKLSAISDTNLTNGTIGKNPRARYSVHFHRSGLDSQPGIVYDNVVENDPGWGYVNHSSNVDMTRNVAFDVIGSGFNTETGNETGSFIGNLAIYMHGNGSRGHENSSHAFADGGHGFWVHSGAGMIVDDNIVSGAKGTAYGSYPLLSKAVDGVTKIPVRYTKGGDPNSSEMVNINTRGYKSFKRNIAYASNVGFQVGKYRPKDNVIEDFLAYNVKAAAGNQYSANMHFINPIAINDIYDLPGNGNDRAFRMHHGTSGVEYHNPYIVGFGVGIDMQASQEKGDKIFGGYFNNKKNISLWFAERQTITSSYITEPVFGKLPNYENQIDLSFSVHLTPWQQKYSMYLRAYWDNPYTFELVMDDVKYQVLLEAMAPDFIPIKHWYYTYERFIGATKAEKKQRKKIARMADINPNKWDMTNEEHIHKRSSSTQGYILPRDYKTREDFIRQEDNPPLRLSGSALLRRIKTGNNNPLPVSEATYTRKNEAITLDVLKHATDYDDGDVLSVSAVTQGVNGTVAIDSEGTLTYTPNTDFLGNDSFTFTLSDNRGGTAKGTIDMQVLTDLQYGNTLYYPFANGATDESTLGQDNTGTLTTGATVVDGVLNLDGSQGKVKIVDTRDVNFSIKKHQAVSVKFKTTDASKRQVIFEKGNGEYGANIYIYEGLLYVGSYGTGGPPSFISTPITANEWHTITVNMTQEDKTMKAYLDGEFIDSAFVHRNIEELYVALGAVNTKTLFHDGSSRQSNFFSGQIDEFRYYNRVLTIDEIMQLAGRAKENEAPIAIEDIATTNENEPVTIDVLENDTDVDSPVLDVISTTEPNNGSVEINDDNSITYTPNLGFKGEDRFTYTISDGNEEDSAEVIITVTRLYSIEVTTTEDGVKGSLRFAILYANATDGEQEIMLEEGVYQLSVSNDNPDLTGDEKGDLDVKDNLIITGLGIRKTVIDANQIDRVMQAHSGVNLELRHLTLTNGKTVGGGAGAIANGNLILTNVEITNSLATQNGGGILVPSFGTLTAVNLILSGNTGNIGGGIFVNGKVTITNANIESNTSVNMGGGVFVKKNSVLILNNSIVNLNKAGKDGGGIYNNSQGTLKDVSLFDNDTPYRGDELYQGSNGELNASNLQTHNESFASLLKVGIYMLNN